MKFGSSVFLVCFLASLGLASSSKVAPRVYYNEVGSCTDEEYALLLGPTDRRQLRSLQQTCTRCLLQWDYCAGWSTLSTCKQTVCSTSCRRDLIAQDFCELEMAEIEAQHVAAYDGLSASCKEHVDTRKIECYKVHEKGGDAGVYDIKSFTLWDADDDRVVKENLVDGDSFCENGFQFSVEAVTGKRVKQVKFELYGVTDYNYEHTESKKPYMMYAGIGTRNIQGTMYKAGDYELIATPDGDITKAKILKFTIKPSTHADCIAAATAPVATCTAQTFMGECARVSDCRSTYRNLGADSCRSGDSVCYCGGLVCGCLATLKV